MQLLDEQILQQMIKDTSAEIMLMLIEHYIEESELRLINIYQAIDNQDKTVLEFEAHTLGSSALALGNRALSNLARKIEHLCLDDKQEYAFTLKHELQTLAQQSLQALKERQRQGFSEA